MQNVGTCTVGLSGGLGNQMFQYAAGRAIALRSNTGLTLDLSFYGRRRHRAYELSSLPIVANAVQPSRARRFVESTLAPLRAALPGATASRYREPHFHFDPAVLSLRCPVRIDGYFQSEKYFADHAETIRTELQIPAATDSDSRRLAEILSSSDSVVMHVRRGDYVTNPKASKMFAACTLEYYEHAMQRVPGREPIVVLSDDIGWAQQNLPRVRELVFPDPDTSRTALSDLWLMTLSKHNIIANSTFSWWGAWLSEQADSITIAPSRWFNESDQSDKDLIPSRWLRLGDHSAVPSPKSTTSHTRRQTTHSET